MQVRFFRATAVVVGATNFDDAVVKPGQGLVGK
jgi:hypothetical protein